MKENKKVEWSGCSDFRERLETLKENHKQFMVAPEFKGIRELANKKPRKRIPINQEAIKPRRVVVKVLGTEKNIPYQEYIKYYPQDYPILRKVW